MNRELIIKENGQPIYPIYFEENYQGLDKVFEDLSMQNRKICVVSDSNVAPHYLEEVKEICARHAGKVIDFVFPAGEENKNLKTVQSLYETLIIHRFERKDLLVALGGGVVGDLTGFTAATYLRGISFVQMPTSLLSQVDSSIGGKTGVDFDAYKNMVGAFHQPKAVYINLSTLKTLSERQYLSGMGEILKHGLIKDKAYFEWLTAHREEILNQDSQTLIEMVYRSCQIKQGVVERDPKEAGERAQLNYGHTIGHSIEKAMDFQWLHGECVAAGAVAASYISWKKGGINENDFTAIKDGFASFDLPVAIKDLDENELLAATKSDKKMDAGSVKFILLDGIGNACIRRDVSDEDMMMAIEYLLGR